MNRTAPASPARRPRIPAWVAPAMFSLAFLFGLALGGCEDPKGRSERISEEETLADLGFTPVDPEESPPGTFKARLDARPLSGSGLQTVRTGRHEDYDRVVFQFAGDGLPVYEIQKVNRPEAPCTGEAVAVEGRSWILVRFEEDASGTIPQETKLGWDRLQEMELVCDAIGNQSWILGVRRGVRHRVIEMKDPARLVVDLSTATGSPTDR